MTAMRHRPITALALLGVALYAYWEGFVLNHYVQHFGANRLAGFAGPMLLWSIRTWSFLYLAVGVLMTVRLLFLMRRPKLDLAAHILCMIPIFAWAVAFDLGPATTGQPAYTFVAVVLLVIPLITRIFEAQLKGRQASAMRQFLAG